MRDDFCIFILTHGRPDKVDTYTTLEKAGYTGKVFIVIDDEDATGDAYRELFGDKVLTFSKAEVAKTFDEADNFHDRRVIVYARNACFDLAKKVHCRYFMQLDDDYSVFAYRINGDRYPGHWRILNLDRLLETVLDFYTRIPALTIAFGQGGDYPGGDESTYLKSIMTRRKVMNTFICDTERPFRFFGRINEDVNTYVTLGGRGHLMLSLMMLSITQHQTQSNAGGMSDVYRASGTYVKSFYTLMHAPAATKIGMMHTKFSRIHHLVRWNNAVPKIIRQEYRKA